MSIRPVQITPLALSPPAAARQSDASSPAPVALAQGGVPALAASSVPPASPSGTAPASGIASTVDGARANADARATIPTELEEALEQAQKLVDGQGRDLSFSIHDKTGEVVVKIIDRESKEVIKQIPAEEMLRLAERLQELEGQNKPGLLLKQEV